VSEATAHTPDHSSDGTRRDFIHIAAGAVFAGGVAMAAWPFIDQMNPSGDVLALASTEYDLSQTAEGSQTLIKWRGKPVFVRHRTAAEIAAAKKDDTAALKDAQTDAERLMQSNGEAGKDQYLIVEGNCTHLGCVPLGVNDPAFTGSYGGWFCPCHGSDYDTSGRIRKGPAPTNLVVPPYLYTNDTVVKIG